MKLLHILTFLGWLELIWATGCHGNRPEVDRSQLRRRSQPGSLNATSQPHRELEWGQLNFLHTTDTHGWLAGHLREKNYGADWGDFISFVRAMKDKATSLGVDLLLIDTGDLVDGSGLSDKTAVKGLISKPIFEKIDYDLLTVGNHELKDRAITYNQFEQFSQFYEERYLTSNVKIVYNNESRYLGRRYRYFTTPNGLRIMAFGVLYNFPPSDYVKVTKAKDMIHQKWFLDAVQYPDPVDLYIITGHNPVRLSHNPSSTLGLVFEKIRELKPDAPILIFGGHSHERDTVVYDDKAVGIESGRFCETLGWMSISGFDIDSYGAKTPTSVPTPKKPAVPQSNLTASGTPLAQGNSLLRYARRYLDWNRLTFEYHAKGSQGGEFDTREGKSVSAIIEDARKRLNLSHTYGCAPKSFCMNCRPYGDPDNLYTLVSQALAQFVVNDSRKNISRIILAPRGGVRYDLIKGPFTIDDSFSIIPYKNTFKYIANVPYSLTLKAMDRLNKVPDPKQKPSIYAKSLTMNSCQQSSPLLDCDGIHFQSNESASQSILHGAVRKRATERSPGYVTVDDLGDDGDDTLHSMVDPIDQPEIYYANASFPNDRRPETVDLVFVDFLKSDVLAAMKKTGMSYSSEDVQQYTPQNITTHDLLPLYAMSNWRKGTSDCPIIE